MRQQSITQPRRLTWPNEDARFMDLVKQLDECASKRWCGCGCCPVVDECVAYWDCNASNINPHGYMLNKKRYEEIKTKLSGLVSLT